MKYKYVVITINILPRLRSDHMEMFVSCLGKLWRSGSCWSLGGAGIPAKPVCRGRRQGPTKTPGSSCPESTIFEISPTKPAIEVLCRSTPTSTRRRQTTPTSKWPNQTASAPKRPTSFSTMPSRPSPGPPSSAGWPSCSPGRERRLCRWLSTTLRASHKPAL